MDDDDFPIINFSNSKHVDKKTLSRIRSHAQQRVQDQKLSQRVGNAGGKEVAPAVPSSASRNRPGLHLVFERKSGKEVRRPRGARSSQRQPAGGLTASDQHVSLGTSPLNKQDPFSSFPIPIDAELISLFEHYYLGWQWNHAKSSLFNETIQNPILACSFLAVAYNVCRHDDVKTMFYESKCMQHVANEVGRIANCAVDERQADICNLMWAICRLATIKVNQGQLEISLNHLNALALVSPTMKDWDFSEYGSHLKSCVAGLLMANCTRLRDVNPILLDYYQLDETSAVVDVKAIGFKVPAEAVVLDPAVSGFLTPEIMDAMLALTAVYNTQAHLEGHEVDGPVGPVAHASSGTQAYEGLRVSLRLAKLRLNDNSLVAGQYDWKAAFQDCVRYCALLFPWSFGNRIIRWGEAVDQAHRHNRQYLTAEMLDRVQEESGHSQAMRDLLLWMFTVLGVSADKDGREHYITLARNHFPDVRYRSYEEICRLAESLPWIDVRTRALAEAFWEASMPKDMCTTLKAIQKAVADTPEGASRSANYYVVPCATSNDMNMQR